ncbi:MAG: hypothetical protein HEP71_16595 [Roseivirga sp.]|nr:hypothetical protein [Roseivirga sp.]
MNTKRILSIVLALATCSCYGQELKTFEARNGVDFAYELMLPEGYDKSKSYELAMVFSEIEADNHGFEPTRSALKEVQGLKNMILFIPKVPLGKPHWISHPIHHGLNDFMKNMRSSYGKPNQKFHFIGHLRGGRVAQTYSGMSSEYVASVSFANSTHWTITKQEYFDGIFNLGFKVYVYSDQPAKNLALNVSKTIFKQVSDFGNAISLIDEKIRSY